MAFPSSQDVDIEDTVGSVVDSPVNTELEDVPSRGFSDIESDDGFENIAPIYPIAKRIIGAVEVPMIVMNLDRAERAFGNVSTFDDVGSMKIALGIPRHNSAS